MCSFDHLAWVMGEKCTSENVDQDAPQKFNVNIDRP